MRELFIHANTNQGYLKNGLYCEPLKNKALIQGAILLGEQKSFPANQKKISHLIKEIDLVFIQLSSDPISRIKRGTLYSKIQDIGQPTSIYYDEWEDVFATGAFSNACQAVQAYKFTSYDLTRNFSPKNTFILFGNDRFETRWRILSIDVSVSNEEIYTIQEVNSIGAIPSLNKNIIPINFFSEIDKEYNSLLEELSASPESVIDHCRDLATSLLTAFIGDVKKEERLDLGQLISKIDPNCIIIVSSAKIINRLHPRRKPNELDKYSLSELTRAESDFSIQCIFQIIREMKWDLK